MEQVRKLMVSMSYLGCVYQAGDVCLHCANRLEDILSNLTDYSLCTCACMHLILRLVCVIQDTEPRSEALFTPTKHHVISLSSGSEYGMPQKPDMKRTRLSFGRYICVGCSRI